MSAILVGANVRPYAQELLEYGVDEVWMLENSTIGDFDEDVHAELVTQILLEKQARDLSRRRHRVGRSLLPRVAARVLTGLTADCTELAIDPATMLLRQTRPAFGGNIMATILTQNHRPQMATVRHKVMKPAEKVANPKGKVIEFNHIEAPKSELEFLEFVEEKTGTVNLAEADIIVSRRPGAQGTEELRLHREAGTGCRRRGRRLARSRGRRLDPVFPPGRADR